MRAVRTSAWQTEVKTACWAFHPGTGFKVQRLLKGDLLVYSYIRLFSFLLFFPLCTVKLNFQCAHWYLVSGYEAPIVQRSHMPVQFFFLNRFRSLSANAANGTCAFQSSILPVTFFLYKTVLHTDTPRPHEQNRSRMQTRKLNVTQLQRLDPGSNSNFNHISRVWNTLGPQLWFGFDQKGTSSFLCKCYCLIRLWTEEVIWLIKVQIYAIIDSNAWLRNNRIYFFYPFIKSSI